MEERKPTGCLMVLKWPLIIAAVLIFWLVHSTAPATSCGYTWFETPNCAEADAYLRASEVDHWLAPDHVPLDEKYYILKERKEEALKGGRW